MRAFAALLAFSALTLVAAQGTGTAGTNFTIDVNAVPLDKRASWCTGQSNTCDALCVTNPTKNECDITSLKFTCTCQNGTAPGLQFYTQTMPTFICQEAFEVCNARNVGNQDRQEACIRDIRNNCGSINPPSLGPSTTTTTTAAPTTSGGAPTGAGAPTTTSSSRALAVPTGHPSYGSGAAVVALGLLAYMI